MRYPGLSRREALVLEAVERALRKDRRLDRMMRTMRPTGATRVRQALCRPRGATVAAAAAGCMALLVTAVTTGAPLLLVATMACWLATVLLTFAWLCARPLNE